MFKCLVLTLIKRKWLSGRRRQTVNLLVIPTLVRIQSFSILKRSRNQTFFLKKSIKIFIRKAKTVNSFKKDVLVNLTLSKNSLKIKNVLSVISLFSINSKNSWVYSKTLEKNILKEELRRAQITICSAIALAVIDNKMYPKTSLKLSDKHKFFNFLAFHAVGRTVNPQYKNYSSHKWSPTVKLSELKNAFFQRSNFLKSILKSQEVYYSVPLDRQFSLSKFNKSFLKIKHSTDRISIFLKNWYSVLQNTSLSKYSSNLRLPDAMEVVNRVNPLASASVEWLLCPSEKKKQALTLVEWEIQKCLINIDPSLEFNFKNSYKIKNLPHLDSNLVKLSFYYMHASCRTYLFTQGLVASKLPKLINPAILILNFRKSRFFPSLTNLKGRLFATMSLGMFSKFFNKGKSFIKNKSVFLLIAGFLRKLILFSEIKGAMLQVKRVPLYFKEILSALHDPVVSFYKNPFTGQIINESEERNTFKFTSFMFINNKPYGKVKNKQKGRLKRKITKRLISINRMVD